MEDRLIATPEAAEMLGVSASSLQQWRLVGEGPPFVRVGANSVRYSVAALREWIASRSEGGK